MVTDETIPTDDINPEENQKEESEVEVPQVTVSLNSLLGDIRSGSSTMRLKGQLGIEPFIFFLTQGAHIIS